MAADDRHPEGFWILENTNPEMPCGGLTLNRTDRFKLLIYDDKCQLYTVEGSIKQKSSTLWELKNAADYSNTFLMSRDDKKLKLIDTEDHKMLFLETTRSGLNKEITQHCEIP